MPRRLARRPSRRTRFNGRRRLSLCPAHQLYYDQTSDKLYFHSGKTGYKIDCIRHSQKVCFTASDDGVRLDGEWWLTIRSVIAFGKIEIIEDRKTIERISRLLSEKFTSDKDYVDREIEKYASATTLLALSVEHLTGKVVREK